jgi:hypothetical protein
MGLNPPAPSQISDQVRDMSRIGVRLRRRRAFKPTRYGFLRSMGEEIKR